MDGDGEDLLQRLNRIEDKLNRVLIALGVDTLSASVGRVADHLDEGAGEDVPAPGDTSQRSGDQPAAGSRARPAGTRRSA
jgi:hypothetical protein